VAARTGSVASVGMEPRGDESDVLAGWDPAGPPPPLDGRPPFPVDTAVALGAMTAGAALGWLAGPPHRLRRMAVGKLLGLAGAIAGRRMWRLPEEPRRRG
jgi:hypothetical protein